MGWLESANSPVLVNQCMNDSKPVPHDLLWPEVDSLKDKSHGLCQNISPLTSCCDICQVNCIESSFEFEHIDHMSNKSIIIHCIAGLCIIWNLIEKAFQIPGKFLIWTEVANRKQNWNLNLKVIQKEIHITAVSVIFN